MSKPAQQADARTTAEGRHIGLLSQAGLVAAIAALIGASCCALPLALAWAGLAGAWIANLGVFVVYRPYITGVALAVIGLGWVIALRRKAPRRTLVVLGVATALLGTAVAVAYYENELTRNLTARMRR
jgi:mercuric ion transport protein